MHTIYELARYYPFWAIPMALISGEFGLFCRRRESPAQWIFWCITGGFILTTLIWIIARGDANSDKWVKAFLG